MPALVLVSAKGSPGVTTAAAALAAVRGRVRARPAGRARPVGRVRAGAGVGPSRLGPRRRGRPAAARVGTRARSGQRHRAARRASPPCWLPRPGTSPNRSSARRVTAGCRRLRAAAPDVVVDAGRWEPSQRTAHRIAGADLVGLVCRPTVGGIEAARLALERLHLAARAPVVVIVVGRKPYRPEEIAGHLDVPLGGTLAWDPRGVAALWVGGAGGRWRRSSLGEAPPRPPPPTSTTWPTAPRPSPTRRSAHRRPRRRARRRSPRRCPGRPPPGRRR